VRRAVARLAIGPRRCARGRHTGGVARRCVAAVGLVLVAVAAARAGAAVPPYRLIDHSPDLVVGHLIDGVWMRTFAPLRARTLVPVQGAPTPAVLRFSLGVTPSLRGGAEFSVVFVAADGTRTVLYTRAVKEAGWVDDEIDLGDRDPNGAKLLFKKRTLDELPMKAMAGARWGEPVLMPRASARTSPSVILVSIDTLRADAVGGAPSHTPVLDALARAGVSYATSYSASTWTYPSHAALMRGLNAGSLPDREPRMSVAPKEEKPPLAQVFRAHGYATAGFTGGGFLSLNWGFPQGFDRYYAFEQPSGGDSCLPERFDGVHVFERARRWLAANASRPFFLFVHTYDVHDRCPVEPEGLGPFQSWPDPGPAGREKLKSYYTSLVGRADKLVGELLAQVDALGLAEKTIVVVTSDHGEAFWEHDGYGHGCAVRPFDPVTRVPLILRGPGIEAGKIVAQPVSAVDVAPTLLALAGLPVPPEMEGKPLPGLGLAGARAAGDPVYVQCGDNLAVRVGDRKLLSQRQGGAGEVYDLAADSGEKANVIGADTASDQTLRALAEKYWGSATAETRLVLERQKTVDDSTRERLRALGYIE